MLRGFVIFGLLCVPTAAFAQSTGGPSGAPQKVGCFVNITRNCGEMAVFAVPVIPGDRLMPVAPCSFLDCEMKDGIRTCKEPFGLTVTDWNRTFSDVDPVPNNVLGRSATEAIQEPWSCADVFKCKCRPLANKCENDGDKVDEYLPWQYSTVGPIDCLGGFGGF